MADGADCTGRCPQKAVRAVEPPPPQIVAVVDREGMVLAVIASRVEARAYLRGGRL